MKKLINLLIIFISVYGTTSAFAQDALDVSVFDQIVSKLEKGIDGKQKRIAIRPFEEDELPVAKATGEVFNDALIAAFQRKFLKTSKQHQLVARDELLKVFAEVEEFHQLEFQKILDSAKADILVIGKVSRAPEGGVYISYRANDVLTGQILSSSAPLYLNYNVENDLDVTSAKNLEAALDRMVQEFSNQLGKVAVIRPKGFYYADTGIQTRFGEYTSDLFLEKMNAATGAREGETIAITGAQRKLKINSAAVDEKLVTANESDFLFKGTYWDQGKYVELRMMLKNASGKRVKAKALVLKESIGDALTLLPDEDLLSVENPNFAGPLGLYLSSDRGNNPVYEIGSDLNLLVQLSEDAYLYCFYHAIDSSVVKLYPNSFQPDAKLTGEFLHQIPGDTMPFQLSLAGPTGVERIHCFATDRDVDSYLPAEIRANDFAELSTKIVKQINSAFRSIPDIRISEASMMVTLE
ncbi:DUF4384 domain-containing protein [Curvivirga sp.]|uniref:DUF4384 domain-containing protein n=1 Tax=Curvivirga sp. TaxID=2856848 RepID=UPI003B5BF9D5